VKYYSSSCHRYKQAQMMSSAIESNIVYDASLLSKFTFEWINNEVSFKS
jgi:hypothetical protein